MAVGTKWEGGHYLVLTLRYLRIATLDVLNCLLGRHGLLHGLLLRVLDQAHGLPALYVVHIGVWRGPGGQARALGGPAGEGGSRYNERIGRDN